MVEVGWQFLDLGPFQCTQMALIRCGPDVGILAEDITGLSRPSTASCKNAENIWIDGVPIDVCFLQVLYK